MDVGLPGARRVVHETDGVVSTFDKLSAGLFEQLLGTRFPGFHAKFREEVEGDIFSTLHAPADSTETYIFHCPGCSVMEVVNG